MATRTEADKRARALHLMRRAVDDCFINVGILQQQSEVLGKVPAVIVQGALLRAKELEAWAQQIMLGGHMEGESQ